MHHFLTENRATVIPSKEVKQQVPNIYGPGQAGWEMDRPQQAGPKN